MGGRGKAGIKGEGEQLKRGKVLRTEKGAPKQFLDASLRTRIYEAIYHPLVAVA